MCFGIFTGFFVRVPMEFLCIFKENIIRINLKELTLRIQIAWKRRRTRDSLRCKIKSRGSVPIAGGSEFIPNGRRLSLSPVHGGHTMSGLPSAYVHLFLILKYILIP